VSREVVLQEITLFFSNETDLIRGPRLENVWNRLTGSPRRKELIDKDDDVSCIYVLRDS
jgi:hypothetical protein